MADATHVCVVGDSSSVSAARGQLRRDFGVWTWPFAARGDENQLIYVLTRKEETFIPLKSADISAALSDCESADGVFHDVYGRWDIGPAPEPNRGSAAGQRLMAKLAKAEGFIEVGEALEIRGIEYVCLEPAGAPQTHIQTIAREFGEQLPKSGLGAPARGRYEHDIYVRTAAGERIVTIAANGGLSANGEPCVKGPKAVFRKAPGERDWKLASGR